MRRHEGAEDPTNCTVYSVQEIKKKNPHELLAQSSGPGYLKVGGC